jgi:uncharacterized protein (DUF433 family)
MQIINHIIIKDGEARIEGKDHLKVEMIARMYVEGDYSIEDVMTQYGLTAGEVHAAIAYYYDNRAELDAAYVDTLKEIRQNAMTLEKFKTKLAAKNSGDEN